MVKTILLSERLTGLSFYWNYWKNINFKQYIWHFQKFLNIRQETGMDRRPMSNANRQMFDKCSIKKREELQTVKGKISSTVNQSWEWEKWVTNVFSPEDKSWQIIGQEFTGTLEGCLDIGRYRTIAIGAGGGKSKKPISQSGLRFINNQQHLIYQLPI
jgi:hypothetical protein